MVPLETSRHITLRTLAVKDKTCRIWWMVFPYLNKGRNSYAHQRRAGQQWTLGQRRTEKKPPPQQSLQDCFWIPFPLWWQWLRISVYWRQSRFLPPIIYSAFHSQNKMDDKLDEPPAPNLAAFSVPPVFSPLSPWCWTLCGKFLQPDWMICSDFWLAFSQDIPLLLWHLEGKWCTHHTHLDSRQEAAWLYR